MPGHPAIAEQPVSISPRLTIVMAKPRAIVSQQFEHLLRRPSQPGLIALGDDWALDDFRMRHHARDQFFWIRRVR